MTIRSQLLLLVLLATMLPTVLVGTRFYFERERGIDSAVDKLTQDAASIAGSLNDRIMGTAQLHYGLSQARDLDTPDRAACSAFLARVLGEYPQYTGILTINPDGSLFCDSLATGRDLDLRTRKYFIAALAASGSVTLEPVFGQLTGMAVLQIAWPARTPLGELKFVLLASLSLEKIVQDRAAAGTEILLTDSAGTVLAWSPSAVRAPLKGTSIATTPLFAFATKHAATGGAAQVDGIDGIPQVWATATTPALTEAGLRVLVGQSRGDLTAAANRRFAQDMIVLAVLALILFLGVWLLAELGIRRQFARIGTMATQLGAGDLQARILPPYPRGEVGDLMMALNVMAASLEDQHAAIEELNHKLRQSQKMEAVGQLTGGVAHDFNNLLTVIIGNTDELTEALHAQPDLKQLAALTMMAAERAADLTRSLLAFARRQPLVPQTVDINRLMLDMNELLRRTLGAHIECRFAFANTWPASIDPAQLQTAILNLALNARDAMPDGGRLTVETGNETLDDMLAAQNDILPGDYVVLSVSDSGVGMPPEVIGRAVEPFFTTKDIGKGTGLGLSMVYGFVKQSGGHIKIYSEVGHGTIVKLYLPRSDGQQTDARPAADLPMSGGGETILAVEDNDMVRGHVANELRRLGYTVLVAGNGVAALAILQGPAVIDLLFTDVVMPGGLSGPQLAAKAQAFRPTLKVLYTSGYTENTVIHHGQLDPGIHLLSKPYRRQELAIKLRLVLDGE